MDPSEEARIRLELAEKSLEEAKDYMGKILHKLKRDSIERSYKLPQYEEVKAVVSDGCNSIGNSARGFSKILKELRIEQA